MPLIDDEGRVLGIINVVDLVALLLVLAFVATIITVLPAGPQPTPQELTVVVETTERPYVTSALEAANGCDRGATIEHVLVEDRVRNETREVQLDRLRIRARVAAERSAGVWKHSGQDIWVGGPLRLDLCSVRVDGTVVRIGGEGDGE